eukprot:CAMPEP_0179430118 /NCGR_PEP_ID=MMETSP0799-20121207/15348_1 /TAXON_ID=46947 /ORGANISM="Geminigera cryophila, Strain CCMP2564" /LENGTH=67 /DNA_ID=CAMNT_0021206409 /DNA_START=87 /DNA_END=290 /DNA_ORIENTATION=+
MGLKMADMVHRTAVAVLAGTTLYSTGFIFVRLRDIKAKAKEVEEYAFSNKTSLEQAAIQLGYRSTSD